MEDITPSPNHTRAPRAPNLDAGRQALGPGNECRDGWIDPAALSIRSTCPVSTAAVGIERSCEVATPKGISIPPVLDRGPAGSSVVTGPLSTTGTAS